MPPMREDSSVALWFLLRLAALIVEALIFGRLLCGTLLCGALVFRAAGGADAVDVSGLGAAGPVLPRGGELVGCGVKLFRLLWLGGVGGHD
ncbi:hypothetical protein GCM10011586_23780 [Silvibacterium dinghuense]|nr:hypothetical protein GCM10011586_23780 [Silvibacterium dinghuense]